MKNLVIPFIISASAGLETKIRDFGFNISGSNLVTGCDLGKLPELINNRKWNCKANKNVKSEMTCFPSNILDICHHHRLQKKTEKMLIHPKVCSCEQRNRKYTNR